MFRRSSPSRSRNLRLPLSSRTARRLLLALGLALLPGQAIAWNRYLEIPSPEEATDSRAYRYANLSNEQALQELEARGIPFTRVDAVPGVRLPIRLTGRLHGVWIHSVLPPEERKTTPFEILDGRLALALDDFTVLLEAHGYDEVIHFTMYRPPHDRPAARGEFLHRHPGGMAIDLGAIRKTNGQWSAVGPHWPSQIGAKTCGEGGRELRGRKGREILSLACEAADLRIFHYMLTPHFDEPHADHLHLEIKSGVKWFLVN